MKNIVLSVLLILMPSHTLFAHNNLVSLTTTDYDPYHAEDMREGGVLTELIRAAFEKAKIKMTVTWFPFSRAIKHAQYSAEYDGIYSIWYTPERAKWAYFSDPIIPNVLGFYRHKDTELPAYWNMKYLKVSAKTVGVVRSYLNPKKMIEAGLDTLVSDSDLLNLRVLLAQRVDLIVIDKMVAESLIEQHFESQKESFIWLDPPLEYKMQYLAIAKNAPNAKEKIAAFNRALKEIRRDGTYQNIMRKHGFDWLLKGQNNWLNDRSK
ncbi:hypothetical protein A9Q77_10775 [Marinomonas sp. 42_23_T18]|nr:hypothetical protein A9Q77_10775 [Marinomonas sp. 42_23_T18]